MESGDKGPALVDVDQERAQDALVGDLAACAGCARHEGAHPGQEHPMRIGGRDVVVGSRGKGQELVDLVATWPDDENRQIARGANLAALIVSRHTRRTAPRSRS